MTHPTPAASSAGAVATLTATVTPRRGRPPAASGLSSDWRMETRLCPVCGDVMRPKKRHRGPSEWRRMIVCSRSCSSRNSHKNPARKIRKTPAKKSALWLDRRAGILQPWPEWASFEDDPRAKSDAFPAKVVPKSEWERET